MLDALPPRAFFRFELPIHYSAKGMPCDGTLRKWTPKYQLPALAEVDGAEPFADVYAAWNDDHLYFAVDVPQRTTKLRCDPQAWWKGDGIRLCIDTRDTRDNKRATRYCHFIYVLPSGGGSDKQAPIVGQHRMSRSKEPPPAIDTSKIPVAAHIQRNRYAIEVAIPGQCLSGWQPSEHPRIGIFYKVKDLQHGPQHLSATDELGWNVDPSSWATGVLVR